MRPSRAKTTQIVISRQTAWLLRVSSYNLNTGKFQKLGLRQRVLNGDDVLYVDPEGKYLLLALRKTIYEYPAVYQVEISSNVSKKIIKPQKQIWTWIADNQGTVRVGVAYKRRVNKIYYRRNNAAEFQLVGQIMEAADKDEKDESLLDILHVVSESDDGYVLSNKETGRFALYRFNYLTRKIGEKILDHPENDISSFQLNDAGTDLLSAQYTDAQDRIVWYDKKLKRLQERLEKSFPDQEVWIQSRSKDEDRMVIFTTSATDPGSYYIYTASEGRMNRIGGINDPIDPAQMSQTKYVHYQARDGLKIHAYLTLPRGRSANKLPLIIMPHGGPFNVRDTADFNSQVQFLANRGYAMLQPNFRGSDSCGDKFYEIGEGQIGRAMQDDLDDGMDWLAKQGLIDEKRVCLVGSSYGGYAAIWGVIRNPERYRCAASFAGVTDWKRMLRYNKQFLRSRFFREYKDRTKGEGQNLNDVSPLIKASQLKRPLLIVHGMKDSIVPFSQFALFKEATGKANIEIETAVYPKEGHGFSKRENQIDWYNRLDKFLKKHNAAH